jgi:hypothetical protein
MKKILIISLVIMMSISLAGLAFADTTFCSANVTTCTYTQSVMGGGLYQPSTNVTVRVFSTKVAYCAASRHLNATVANKGKEYATMSTDTTLREQVVQTDSTTGVPSGCTNETTPTF